MAWVALLSVLAAAPAERWADEAQPQAQAVEERLAPRFGLTAGLHATLTERNLEAPFPGVRLGVRVRLAEHLALAVFATYELESYLSRSVNPGTLAIEASRTAGHMVQGVVRLEFFTSSAFDALLIPNLSVGAFFAMGAVYSSAFAPTTLVVGRGGLSLSLARLQPSGWWFPFFLEVGQEFAPGVGENAWYFGVGAGL